MKKTAVAIALASVFGAVHAQSNVTLFGVADAAVRHVKNGDRNVTSLASNGLQSNRLGVRGSEDLGGGLRAEFWLEHGLSLDTGAVADANRFWNRRATVALSNAYGEIRIGRDFTPSYTGFTAFDVFGANGVGAADKFLSRLGTNAETNVRADNQVSYFLPGNLGGAYGHVSVAAGEGTGGKKYAGFRLGYATRALDVSVSFGRTEVTPIAAGEDEFDRTTVGASYDLGYAKVLGMYSETEYASQKLSLASVGVAVPFGPGTVRLGYIDLKAKGRAANGASVEANDASQVALGYVYDLSKRTSLYTTASYVENKGAAAYAVDASPALPTPNNGKSSSGVEVGIRHRF